MKRRLYILPAIDIDSDGYWRGKNKVDNVEGWRSNAHPMKRIIKIVKSRTSFAYLLFYEPTRRTHKGTPRTK